MKFFACVEELELYHLWVFQLFSHLISAKYLRIKEKKRDSVTLGQAERTIVNISVIQSSKNSISGILFSFFERDSFVIIILSNPDMNKLWKTTKEFRKTLTFLCAWIRKVLCNTMVLFCLIFDVRLKYYSNQ
jgi:hypothetical protein